MCPTAAATITGDTPAWIIRLTYVRRPVYGVARVDLRPGARDLDVAPLAGFGPGPELAGDEYAVNGDAAARGREGPHVRPPQGQRLLGPRAGRVQQAPKDAIADGRQLGPDRLDLLGTQGLVTNRIGAQARTARRGWSAACPPPRRRPGPPRACAGLRWPAWRCNPSRGSACASPAAAASRGRAGARPRRPGGSTWRRAIAGRSRSSSPTRAFHRPARSRASRPGAPRSAAGACAPIAAARVSSASNSWASCLVANARCRCLEPRPDSNHRTYQLVRPAALVRFWMLIADCPLGCGGYASSASSGSFRWRRGSGVPAPRPHLYRAPRWRDRPLNSLTVAARSAPRARPFGPALHRARRSGSGNRR